MPGEAFSKAPARRAATPRKGLLDPATFDVEAWLSGATRVTKYVDVYGKPGLQADIDELDSRLRRETDEQEQSALAERIESLRAEMEASRIGFRFQAITEARASDLREQRDEDGDDDLAGAYRCLAAQCLNPALTAEQMRRLCDALGEGYFSQTVLAAANAAQQGLGVTVPFSSAASRVLSR